MFGLKQWFKRRFRPPLSPDELADRVHQRLMVAKDTGDPLQVMLEIAAEEGHKPEPVDQLIDAARLRGLIKQLPPRQQLVLHDHLDRDLNYREIAQERGVSDRIVLRDLTRAYATLRMKMRSENGQGIDDNELGRLSGTTDEQPADLRDTSPHVAIVDRVHSAGSPSGGVLDSPAEQRPDADGSESRRDEPTPPT